MHRYIYQIYLSPKKWFCYHLKWQVCLILHGWSNQQWKNNVFYFLGLIWVNYYLANPTWCFCTSTIILLHFKTCNCCKWLIWLWQDVKIHSQLSHFLNNRRSWILLDRCVYSLIPDLRVGSWSYFNFGARCGRSAFFFSVDVFRKQAADEVTVKRNHSGQCESSDLEFEGQLK